VSNKTSLQFNAPPNTVYRVVQKNWRTLFCTPYNSVKYWPIFKLISLSESGEPF